MMAVYGNEMKGWALNLCGEEGSWLGTGKILDFGGRGLVTRSQMSTKQSDRTGSSEVDHRARPWISSRINLYSGIDQ